MVSSLAFLKVQAYEKEWHFGVGGGVRISWNSVFGEEWQQMS